MISESTEDERKCQRKGDFAISVAFGSASSELCWGVISLIHTPDGAPLCPGQLGASETCFRSWGAEQGLCHVAFSPLLSGLQGAVRLQAWEQLLSLWLCTCCLSVSKRNKHSRNCHKNIYLYIIANQIVRKSRVELGEWVLSLSVPKCLFSPWICWCDLQSILVTKHRLSPASSSSCLKSFPIGRNCILTSKTQVKLTCSMGSWSWGAHPQSLSTTR